MERTLPSEFLDLTSDRIRIRRKAHLVDQNRIAPVVPAKQFLQKRDGFLRVPLEFGLEPRNTRSALLDVSLPSFVNLPARIVHFVPFRASTESV